MDIKYYSISSKYKINLIPYTLHDSYSIEQPFKPSNLLSLLNIFWETQQGGPILEDDNRIQGPTGRRVESDRRIERALQCMWVRAWEKLYIIGIKCGS